MPDNTTIYLKTTASWNRIKSKEITKSTLIKLLEAKMKEKFLEGARRKQLITWRSPSIQMPMDFSWREMRPEDRNSMSKCWKGKRLNPEFYIQQKDPPGMKAEQKHSQMKDKTWRVCYHLTSYKRKLKKVSRRRKMIPSGNLDFWKERTQNSLKRVWLLKAKAVTSSGEVFSIERCEWIWRLSCKKQAIP